MTKPRTALLTGITGQDGSYLAELLLQKGYAVFGLLPHRNQPHFENIQHLRGLQLLNGDMTDAASLERAVDLARPDEVYNLAAMSFVAKSWDLPVLTSEVNYLGFVRLLEACRRIVPGCRIYQAGTSEQFGDSPSPQHEQTPFRPNSHYAVSKTAAHFAARNYRDSYGMYICCGILFNHESPRRGEHFVTQKVARAAVELAAGRRGKLHLGNLDARRDWGYAAEYVEAMWRMLQEPEPDDYVIGTGLSYSVQDCVELAFDYAGVPGDWRDRVIHDPVLLRPVDVLDLRADITKARAQLGWEPRVLFPELLRLMVEHWQHELGKR